LKLLRESLAHCCCARVSDVWGSSDQQTQRRRTVHLGNSPAARYLRCCLLKSVHIWSLFQKVLAASAIPFGNWGERCWWVFHRPEGKLERQHAPTEVLLFLFETFRIHGIEYIALRTWFLISVYE
jgi:hypothetical protein